MSSPQLALSKDAHERSHGVLPPPPSHPDDGPSALDVPPLAAPGISLGAPLRAAEGPTPLRAWLAMVALFVVGTVISYLIQS